jgi:hypothetical protein
MKLRSCVTNTAVTLGRVSLLASHSMVTASRWFVGSSKMYTSCSCKREDARDTRRRCPPDSSRTLTVKSGRPISSRARFASAEIWCGLLDVDMNKMNKDQVERVGRKNQRSSRIVSCKYM